MTTGRITITIVVISVLVVTIIAALRPSSATNARDCIDNLRRIEGAKLWWVTEIMNTNKGLNRNYDAERVWAFTKTNAIANVVPSVEDIRPYLSGDLMMPRCPAGGTYTMGRIADDPTCSIPGHVMK